MFALVERRPHRFAFSRLSADFGIATPEPGNALPNFVSYIDLLLIHLFIPPQLGGNYTQSITDGRCDFLA